MHGVVVDGISRGWKFCWISIVYVTSSRIFKYYLFILSFIQEIKTTPTVYHVEDISNKYVFKNYQKNIKETIAELHIQKI